MILNFEGEIIYWRGPSPFLFVAVPQELSEAIRAISSSVTYGWGCIPVRARVGETEWKTSLFPKNSLYLVPIKVIVQKAEGLDVGDQVAIRLEIG